MKRSFRTLVLAPALLAPLLATGAHALGPATPAEGVAATGVVAAPAAQDRASRLQAVAPTLDAQVLQAALTAHDTAVARGDVHGAQADRLTVIDYARPSSEPRLWVFDLARGELLFHELVAHGEGSGTLHATRFSNEHDSHQTSLGVFRTAEPYVGKHGRSLRLDGLEPGVNDAARERAIVIHGADYVSDAFVADRGRAGLSWGCPAVGRHVSDALIDAVQGGSLVFAWYPDAAWLDASVYLQGA